MEPLRPLFPPEVYAKVCAVPAEVDAYSLRQIIAKALSIEEEKIDVFQKASGGYNCIWEETEGISFSELRWLSEPIRPFLAVSRRIASLTDLVTQSTRLLAVVSISRAVVSDLFDAIEEELRRSDVRTGNVRFQLSREKLHLMPETTLLNIFSASVRHAEHEAISFTYHRLRPTHNVEGRRRFLEDMAKPGDDMFVGITVDGIPVTVGTSQITVHRIDIEFEIIPAVLKDIFDFLRGEVD